MTELLDWATGSAVTALTLLELFPVQYRARSKRSRIQTLAGPNENYGQDFYSRIRNEIRWAPPPAIFSIWFVLYLFIAIGHTFWAINADPVTDTCLYTSIWIVYFVHLFFNKIWSFLFFGMESAMGVSIGLIDIIIVFLLAITQIVLYAIHGAPIVTYVLWGIYLAWILFATILSFAIFSVRNKLFR